MKIIKAPSFSVRICIAGDRTKATDICQKYCDNTGYCVTVEAADYVYTGGMEPGVVVRLINYPRFPATPEEITEKAGQLGLALMTGLGQQSFCVVTPVDTIWYNGRDN